MSTTDHQGFTNYETYVTRLYYSELFQEITRDYLQEFSSDSVESIVAGLADAFEGTVEEVEFNLTPDHTLSRRLVSEWIRGVDWVCLAENEYSHACSTTKQA